MTLPSFVRPFVVAALLCFAAPAFAQSAPPSPPGDARAAAAAMKKQADAAMDTLHYDEALASYQRSYELFPDPAVLYNEARVYQARGEYPEALSAGLRFEQEAPAELKARVAGLSRFLDELREHVATLDLRCNISGARVLVREKQIGVTPLPQSVKLNAGKPLLEVVAEGYLPFHEEVDLRGGVTTPLEVTLKSKDRAGTLAIRVDYTPLYELTPMTLSPNLAFGMDETNLFTTLARTDGKPLQITKLEASEPWIIATLVPGVSKDDTTARIQISIKRDGPPRRFNEFVHVYTAGQSNAPASSVYIYGEVSGEVSVTPEALYWSIVDSAKTVKERPANLITQHVTIRSASGQEIELKNPQSSIQGIKLELKPEADGKAYELIARLDDVPSSTISGNVSFETSVAAQPRIQLPVIVNVFNP